MARLRSERSTSRPDSEADHGVEHPARISQAPWFFEATLKQEIQRRKHRRSRATSLLRMLTRVVLPGSMIVVVVFCSLLAML